jgi:hypothetical protein
MIAAANAKQVSSHSGDPGPQFLLPWKEDFFGSSRHITRSDDSFLPGMATILA